MEFLILAAIFLTSSGFLVGAAVAPPRADATAPAPAAVSGQGGAVLLQPRPKSSGLDTPLRSAGS
ncbi:UNVERIFIED_ORG: hypothetical protein BDU10_9914 [Burkholderia sp. CF145]|nr:hypothetical protein PMI06_008562 [Burkholderia sp. BT03]SKC49470.1 hypothetical protein SAMN06266956_0284 [Paraburkholderia hospita]SKD05726.1 hypothetical protein SAMN05445504_9581 [Burkholderia sp. CF099]